ncbi:hypothetical protein CROQUDRAFT_105324 [Cronartium quercuum f. sp. fusiforme G11]|uniref:SH3 domain-containing protein n=1 Tax=Cronartium quercuum f. sp. fusiforme G11 TaxID=708437 RepID=A0A9P6TEL3_9BASI|nr:hypothetical protein CROQUDRAFT_105324 [Cronartium quercuum f. sp. fusiforme G11]
MNFGISTHKSPQRAPSINSHHPDMVWVHPDPQSRVLSNREKHRKRQDLTDIPSSINEGSQTPSSVIETSSGPPSTLVGDGGVESSLTHPQTISTFHPSTQSQPQVLPQVQSQQHREQHHEQVQQPMRQQKQHQQGERVRPKEAVNRSPARTVTSTPVVFTQNKASVIPQRHSSQPVNQKKKEVPHSQSKASPAAPAKWSSPIFHSAISAPAVPVAQHKAPVIPQKNPQRQVKVPQSKAQPTVSPQGGNVRLMSPPTAPEITHLATSTPVSIDQHQTGAISQNASSKPLTTPPLIPPSANNSVTELPSPLTPLVNTPSDTESFNANLANQIEDENASHKTPAVVIVTLIITCLILAAMSIVVMKRIWQKFHPSQKPVNYPGVHSRKSHTDSVLFGGRERSMQDFGQHRHSSLFHQPHPYSNKRSEHHISSSSSLSDAYHSLAANVILMNGRDYGQKDIDEDVMTAESTAPKPDYDEKKLYPTCDYDDIQPGSVFLVSRTFDPSLPDEILVSPGDRVKIDMVYDDGWCFGTNLDAELRRAAGQCTTLTKGVFPRECLQGSSPRQSLMSKDAGNSRYSNKSVPVASSAVMSNELVAHINISYRSPTEVPNPIEHSGSIPSTPRLLEIGPMSQHGLSETPYVDHSDARRATSLFQELGKALSSE